MSRLYRPLLTRQKAAPLPLPRADGSPLRLHPPTPMPMVMRLHPLVAQNGSFIPMTPRQDQRMRARLSLCRLLP